jgi:flagellar biosynthesis/type III secretory pathway M-ring protein FliF/YscJ
MQVTEGKAGSSGGSDHVSATTTDTHKEYFTPRATEQVVRTAPVLLRLSISLFLDDSLVELEESLTASVKAAVGFRSDRPDVFSLTTLPFAGVGSGEDGEAVAEPAAEPLSPVVETILRRGVEILSALVFLFVLFRSLKGARQLVSRGSGPKSTAPGISPETGLPDVPIEVLARAQVEEILNSNPEKIGEILSSWAREEAPAA